MLTHTQKRTAFAIVNVFETGSVCGEYGQVTLIPGDSGHLTYGRCQTTLRSGGQPGKLCALLHGYAATPGARYARLLQPYLEKATAGDVCLDEDVHFHNILRACADDPVMRDTQDAFFERAFWEPASRAAVALGLDLPLSQAVVYDSYVHGSWLRIRNAVSSDVGAPSNATQKQWIRAYVERRRAWLVGHANAALRATTYRMDCLHRLIELDLWTLELPFLLRGREISTETLAALPPACHAGPAPGSRNLGVQTPMLRGLDVRLLQLGLSQRGHAIVADGVFGKGTLSTCQAHMRREGRPVQQSVPASVVEEIAVACL